MKKIYLLLFLLSAGVFAQGVVRVTPQVHEWQRIFDGVVGANGDGFDTTSAFYSKGWAGHLVVVIETDTTGYNTPDSCLTLYMQQKRKYTYPGNQVTDEDWMTYYNSSDLTKFKIDTLSRARVNDAGNAFYINISVELSSTGEWAAMDSTRFILGIGVGDSLGAKVDVGGQ